MSKSSRTVVFPEITLASITLAATLIALSPAAFADTPAPVPASAPSDVRENVAQNGGEAVDHTHAGLYSAGLNGRVRPVVAAASEPAVRPNLAQNGGDAVAEAPKYAAGLNGRVKRSTAPVLADATPPAKR